MRRESGARGRAGLALLTLAAIGLRARGLDFELPHYTQSDGLILAGQVECGRASNAGAPGYGVVSRAYPPLSSNLVLLLPVDRRVPDAGTSLHEHFSQASRPGWRSARSRAASP